MALDAEEECLIPITQQDIARHVGLSRSTVAQVLTDTGRVHPHTRARILAAARDLGYHPNPVARALVTGKTNTLGFWFYPMLEPFVVAAANRLQMLVPPYQLVLINLGLYKPSWDSTTPDFPPAEWPVDGIFAFETGPLPERILNSRAGAPPLVYIGYDAPLTAPRMDTVTINMRHGAEAAVRHLVATRQRVAMLCVPPVIEGRDGRATAYQAVLRAAGRQPEYILPPWGRPYRLRAYHAFIAHVKAHGCPDAVFCVSDEQATGVNLAAHELGLRVPADLAIVGFDDLDEMAYHVPPLSSIAQPFDDICAVAWELLQKRMADAHAPVQHRVLNTEFIARKSSAG